MKRINWQTEPLAIVGLVKALLAVAAGAGLVVSDQTTAGIVALVAAAATVASTIFNRSKVDSPATTTAKRVTTDKMLGDASAALATSGPQLDRQRLCPAAPEAAASTSASSMAVDVAPGRAVIGTAVLEVHPQLSPDFEAFLDEVIDDIAARLKGAQVPQDVASVPPAADDAEQVPGAPQAAAEAPPVPPRKRAPRKHPSARQ